MAIDIISTFRRYIDEAWNKGHLDSVGEIVSPKQVTYDPFFGEYKGVEGEKQRIMLLRTAFPDFYLQIEDIGLAGDKLFMRWIASGTQRGPLMGIAPTNRHGVVRGMTLMRLEGGKIVETWQSWDTLGMIVNLGVAPALEKFAPPRAHA